MYERILVATDGSDPAGRAVEDAIELAASLGSQLRIVSVAETGYPPAGPEYPTSAFQDMVEAVVKACQETVDAAVETARGAGVDASGIVQKGKRAKDGILDIAQAQNADLIVIGTHGRSGIQRFLLGSVAEGVLRAADVPVLAVRAPETG